MEEKSQEKLLVEIDNVIRDLNTRMWEIHNVLFASSYPIEPGQELALEPILNDLNGMIFTFGTVARAAEKASLRSQCIVKGCSNRKHEGGFTGDICSSCYDMIKTGKPTSSGSFILEMSNELISMKRRFLT